MARYERLHHAINIHMLWSVSACFNVFQHVPTCLNQEGVQFVSKHVQSCSNLGVFMSSFIDFIDPTSSFAKRICFLFATCQVRVVRFYQSLFFSSSSTSSPLPPPRPPPPPCPPPPRPLPLPRPLLPCQLFAKLKLFTNVRAQCAPLDLNLGPAQLSVHRWTSTWDLPSSVCTAGPQPGTFPAQCALLDLNLGPAQLSVHRWTSTWDLPSSVCTAGPQPGTCPAQCAPLDLNLGPSQRSVHCWTSTWDLPSSVCTAGPQPGTFPAQCAPLDLNLGPSQLSAHRWTSTAR